MDDALVDQGRKDNREYSASDVDDLFRCACENETRRAEVLAFFAKIFFLRITEARPLVAGTSRVRSSASSVNVVSEFLQAALPQFLVAANRTICGNPSTAR